MMPFRKSNATSSAGQFVSMLLDTARQVNSPNKLRHQNEEGSPHATLVVAAVRGRFPLPVDNELSAVILKYHMSYL